MSRDPKAQLHVIHLTPDNLVDYEKNGKTKICYFAWETSLVPPEWVQVLNRIPVEIWVPCRYMVDVCARSGITVPVVAIPHAMPVLLDDKRPVTRIKLPQDRYKFYSIFQWSERKNPIGLITAYYREFDADEKVCLVLKTYRNSADAGEKELIRSEITELKRQLRGSKAPPIILIDDLVGVGGIFAIHYNCDCYVTMTRSEGFAIPVYEAASMGKPVIAPRYSSFVDHLDDQNSYLIDVPEEVPVDNMKHISDMYTENMVWGNPSIDSCREMMRSVFEDQKAAMAKGKAIQDYVSQALSYEAIGRLMKSRLDAVFARTMRSR
jgi:glycosyltransferase involved in cell wall biosynthesis